MRNEIEAVPMHPISPHSGESSITGISVHLFTPLNLLPASANRQCTKRRRQFAQGSSPEHFILLCRQAMQLSKGLEVSLSDIDGMV
jgi:hypothetical protein